MTVDRLDIGSATEVLEPALALLRELGDEAEDLGHFDVDRTLAGWRRFGDRVVAIAARDDEGAVIGVATLCEHFAIYANGLFGVLNEMWVAPAHRSRGIGKLLLDEAKSLGRERGWSRLDVAAPESERWRRSRSFYEREGFTFAGPKLKFVL
jgi:GNAT superfamily N-acetyltransferase